MWRIDHENKYKPLDLNIVGEVETTLGYKLPKSYIELLGIQNGGELQKNVIHCEKKTGTKSVCTGRFYPLEKVAINFQEHINIIEEQLAFSDHNRDIYQSYKMILPISVENHGYVCLDYRNSLTDPSVVYFYDEDLVDYYIASSFDDFLKKLFSLDLM
ncbi:SMI1/KNR4 family protein [Paenibacillus sp. Soil750]|nr:SMI1/KNR4 family protein [Paenibacillus sp. Soil750]KRE64167.1 hypothetical protein ASL11_23375 [Paenibacillus sp. Soil750]